MPKAETKINIPRLRELLEAATPLPWRVGTSSVGSHASHKITAQARQGFAGNPDKDTNPIATLATKIGRYREADRRGKRETWDDPIPQAGFDAELIAAAVNVLPELLRRLDMNISEICFLIMWKADVYGPDRYWKAGFKLPIIDPNKATRFARGEDALEVARAIADEQYNPSDYRGVGAPRCEVVEYLFVEQEAD